MKTKPNATSTTTQPVKSYLTQLSTIQKIKLWVGRCVLFIAASLPAVVFASSGAEKVCYSYAVVYLAGGTQPIVILDVIAIPAVEYEMKRQDEERKREDGSPGYFSELDTLAEKYVKAYLKKGGSDLNKLTIDYGKIHPSGSPCNESKSEIESNRPRFMKQLEGEHHELIVLHGDWFINKQDTDKKQSKDDKANLAKSNLSSRDQNANKSTKNTSPAIVLHSENTATADNVVNAKAAAEAKKKADADHRAELAAAKKRADEDAVAKAKQEEKQRQWCMAERTRLGMCECSRYNPAKGSGCSK